jgi:hypothetical protein
LSPRPDSGGADRIADWGTGATPGNVNARDGLISIGTILAHWHQPEYEELVCDLTPQVARPNPGGDEDVTAGVDAWLGTLNFGDVRRDLCCHIDRVSTGTTVMQPIAIHGHSRFSWAA